MSSSRDHVTFIGYPVIWRQQCRLRNEIVFRLAAESSTEQRYINGHLACDARTSIMSHRLEAQDVAHRCFGTLRAFASAPRPRWSVCLPAVATSSSRYMVVS